MSKLDLFKPQDSKKSYSRRNDKIAVQMKECISSALIRGDLYDMPCDSITITHIDLSPDLRNAKIFIMPLGGQKAEKSVTYLEQNKHFFKNVLATKMKLRFIPEIIFRLDSSFEYSQKIETLLNSKP